MLWMILPECMELSHANHILPIAKIWLLNFAPLIVAKSVVKIISIENLVKFMIHMNNTSEIRYNRFIISKNPKILIGQEL